MTQADQMDPIAAVAQRHGRVAESCNGSPLSRPGRGTGVRGTSLGLGIWRALTALVPWRSAAAALVAGALLAGATAAAAAGPPPAAAPAPKAAAPAPAQAVPPEYLIGPGDSLKINVFQNPDLSLEARVAENGTINYPLIGTVPLGGSSVTAAEKKIAQMLKDGGFVVAPQVTITLTQVRGNQVSVLGQVGKPGRYPLETADTKITDMIALAGGVLPTGADVVSFTGVRDGKTIRREIDVTNLFVAAASSGDLTLHSGDIIYVPRAPYFYIYGQVQHPGNFRLERDMTLMQAVAAGGGLTPKGTERGMKVHRRGPDGKVQILDIKLDDPIQPDDVIYVRESIF